MARPKYPSDKQDQFMLRLPDGLRDRVKAAADENKRSMNAEIVDRLENSFESHAADAQEMARAALATIEKAAKDVVHQMEVAKWMQQQQSMAMGLLEIVAASDGNLKPEFLETLKGVLARRGTDSSFPIRPNED